MPSRLAAAACLLLLTLFGILSWSAVTRMGVTTDEPAHAYSAWLIRHHGDYRLDREDPPLWKFLPALRHGRDALPHTLDDAAWQQSLRGVSTPPGPQMRALFQSPGVDGPAFISRSRAAMLPVGIALGTLVTVAAWTLAGPTAAVVACALFCLNPSFLGHTPLVKSDVPFTLVYFAAAFAILQLGRRLTIPRALAVALLVGAATVTKFSGLLLLPAVAIALLVRALLPIPWPAFRHTLTTRSQKILAAAGQFALCLPATWLVLWATYSFRFHPTPDPSISFNMTGLLGLTAGQQLRLAGIPPTADALANWQPDLTTRTAIFASDHRLLPQAWLAGFLYTRASSWNRTSYLLGEIHPGGSWSYFPLAILFKTPLTTLATFLAAIAVALYLRSTRTSGWPCSVTAASSGTARTEPRPPGLDRWTLAALGILFGIYALAALSTDLNIGVRHVFPLFPFLFLLTSLLISDALRRWKPARPIAILLFLALLAETLLPFPHYISYFNRACGGPRNAATLLADSNLDWNQDLLLLADWQKRHPDELLYLTMSTVFDPAIYGIRYTRLSPADLARPLASPTTQPATLATRVSHLQGLLVNPADSPAYNLLRRTPPREILGGSIYLYPYPLTDAALRPGLATGTTSPPSATAATSRPVP